MGTGTRGVGLLAMMVLVAAGVAGVAAQGVRRVDAAVLYLKHCASCHGEKGEGTPGVRPLTGDLAHGDRLEDVERVVRDGIEGSTMTPFRGKLTDAQIRAVAQYVLDLSKKR